MTLTYEEWVDTLPPCPVCGVVDVMDAIEGAPMCAACHLDQMCDDDPASDDGGELHA